MPRQPANKPCGELGLPHGQSSKLRRRCTSGFGRRWRTRCFRHFVSRQAARVLDVRDRELIAVVKAALPTFLQHRPAGRRAVRVGDLAVEYVEVEMSVARR